MKTKLIKQKTTDITGNILYYISGFDQECPYSRIVLIKCWYGHIMVDKSYKLSLIIDYKDHSRQEIKKIIISDIDDDTLKKLGIPSKQGRIETVISALMNHNSYNNMRILFISNDDEWETTKEIKHNKFDQVVLKKIGKE